MTTLDNLIAERKRQKLTQGFIAEQLGVTQGCLSHWESGEREITLADAERYAGVLGMVGLHVSLRITQPADGYSTLDRALTAFPEDDERHWQVQAYLFNLLAHKAQTRADQIRRAKAAPARNGDDQ